MPEKTSIETVKAIYDAFTRGNLADLLEHWGDDATLEWYGPEHIPYAGTWRGRSGAKEWLTLVTDTIDFETWDPQEFYVQGDTVLVVGYEKGTFSQTGRVYEQRWVVIWTVRDGKVVRYRQFADTAACAEALSPA